jgi:hypothetical protein
MKRAIIVDAAWRCQVWNDNLSVERVGIDERSLHVPPAMR